MWIGFAHTLADNPLWDVVPGTHPPTRYGGRPPGLFFAAAVLFKTVGTSIVLSHLLIVCLSFVGVFFTYRLGCLLFGPTAGVLASIFLFCNAIYFAQSGMFLADLPVAALGVTSVYYALREQYRAYLFSACMLVLMKETAMAIVFSIVVYVFVLECRSSATAALKKATRYAVPLLLIASYYIYKRMVTGKFFVDFAFQSGPFYLDAEGALNQLRMVNRWLFVMQYRWVFSLLIVLNLLSRRASRHRQELLLFGLIFVCSGYTFCLLYFLPRYLLPMAPYFFILAAWSLVELLKSRVVLAAGAATLIALQVHTLRGRDRFGNREWSMDYVDVVQTHQAMCRYIEDELPDVQVLTIWPFSSYLRRPELGYVKRPVAVVSFDRAAGEPSRSDVILNGTPAAGTHELASYIRQRDTRLIKRIAAEGAQCELYAGS